MGNQPSDTGSHEEEQIPDQCPVRSKPESESQCPVKPKYKNPHSYNVYAEKIDPNNQMPSNPNQEPAPDQKLPLSKDRQPSTIRKGGTDGTWSYPSEQMFFNALKRKKKSDGIVEQDIETVIKIHNGTNERAWKNVMEWEKMHRECEDPTLLKFMGRPNDPSIKSWVSKSIFRKSHFDRHDWIIDRCGKEVRYILDFYYQDSDADLTKREGGFFDTKSSVEIDVRPAMFDSLSNFRDFWSGLFKKKILH